MSDESNPNKRVIQVVHIGNRDECFDRHLIDAARSHAEAMRRVEGRNFYKDHTIGEGIDHYLAGND